MTTARVYRAYLQDPDLQDARARWPFVAIWDNHEFSWLRLAGLHEDRRKPRSPAQTRKVAANQAWFEFQPARVAKPGGGELDRFVAPAVVDAPVERFDEHGLGQEPNNLAAIGSLTVYRACASAATSTCSSPTSTASSPKRDGRPEAEPLHSQDFPNLVPEEVNEIFDAGRAYADGKPPATIRFGDAADRELRARIRPRTPSSAPRRRHGSCEQLKSSSADLEGLGQFARHARLARRSAEPAAGRSGKSVARRRLRGFGGGDHGAAYVTERAEIYDFVREQRITGFATVAGDRHSFWAGRAAKALPPRPFEPVGVEFITGSVSAPALPEGLEHNMPKDHPLRSLFVHQPGPARRISAR